MAAVSTRAPAVKDALVVVREELKDRKLNAFVIPSGDPHLSEYAADHFCRRVRHTLSALRPFIIDLHTIRQSVRHTWISIVRGMKEGGHAGGVPPPCH